MNLQEVGQEAHWDLMMLFGSRARQTAGQHSDYDIAVLPGRGQRRAEALFQAIGSDNLDIVWMDDASWLLWQEVSRDGIALYERTPGQYQEFRSEALRRSWDADIWRQRNRNFVERTLREDWTVNRDLIERKLALVSQYLGELKPVLELSKQRFVSDPMVHHAAERLIELLVECAAAINSEASQAVAGIPPSDYYSSFFSLVSTGWIEQETAQALGQWARIRNTLVHRYETVGLDELHDQLQVCLPSWRAYLVGVQRGLAGDTKG